MRKARANGFLLALVAVSFLAIVTAPSARAQFVCDPFVAGGNMACTNTGIAPFPGPYGANTTLGGNATTTNAAGATSFDDVSTSSEDGLATTNNAGSVFGNVSTSAGGTGGATSFNSSSGYIDLDLTTLTGSGNATAINAGTVNGSISTTAQDGGAALTNNSGIVGNNIFTQTSFFSATASGPATTFNSGTVNGSITTSADGGGDATTNNLRSGTVVGIIATTTSNSSGGPQAGTATSINAGTADSILTQTNDGANAVTINSGRLIGFSGIFNQTADGGDATVINSGIVNGGVVNVSGTNSGDGNATTTNSGTINGSALTAALGNGNAAMTNSGTVNGTVGVLNQFATGNVSFFNSGTVNGVLGVSAFDGNATAYNSGRILGTVNVIGGNPGFPTFTSATFTNAGLVDGTNFGGVAINMLQSDNGVNSTLNFLPGSRVIGKVFLSGADPIDPTFPGTTVNFFTGNMSSVMIFGGNTCGCSYGGLGDTNSTINVIGGAPYVIDVANNTVAVLDPTSFAVQDRNITEFSHTISSMVTSRLNNPAPISGGSSVSGFAPSGSVAADMARDAFAGISSLNYASSDRVLFSNPSMTAADGTSVWAQGFAGQRIQDASAPVLRSVNNFYGGLLGVDKALRPDLRVGGLIGAGSIKSTIDLNSGDTSSDIVFGGVYGRYAMNKSFFDFALIGGYGSNDLRRNMTNNLAPNGLETATATYANWFISPEIAYGVRKDLWTNVTLTPAARVRYVAAGFDGYQESGSTTNLTVASRTSHNFEERAELTLTRTSDPVPTQRMQVSGTLGALALQRAGDTTVNTILLGQNLPFATPGKNDIYGVYSGVGFDWRNINGVTVFGAAEYTAMTDSSRTATAKGGVRVVF